MEDKKEKTKASLPMRELISAPLVAVSEAQKQLATSTWDFYKKLAFEDDGETRCKEPSDTKE